MAEIKIVQRSLKLGEYYKFPLKSLKLLELHKISIHSLYIYLLVQDYLYESDQSIIYLRDIELAYKISPSRFLESLELLRLQKLLIFKRIGADKVIIGIEGFNTGPEAETEVSGHKPLI
jgi:hypothetical protein